MGRSAIFSPRHSVRAGTAKEPPIAAVPLAEARAAVAGRQIALIHYGEPIPLDDGHRPLRIGLLAQWLVDAGAEVVRFAPSFSLLRHQRPLEWSGRETQHGTVEIIPTRSFPHSRSRQRLGFIADFARGTAKRLTAYPDIDLAIVGYPPPGVLTAVRGATRPSLPIIADVRDLWPDSLVPSGHPMLAGLARAAGKAMAAELRRATGVVAVSEMMLDRVPSVRRWGVIPITLTGVTGVTRVRSADAPLVATFVGTFSPLFDFSPMVEGWGKFVESRPRGGDDPVLLLAGGGDRDAEVRHIADGVRGVNQLGWVPSAAVPDLLARSDVGCIPTRQGQGITLGNKAMEYLGAGLHIIHSLEPRIARTVEGFASTVTSTSADWAAAFATVDLTRGEIRSRRSERIEAAEERWGNARIEGLWLDTIARALQSVDHK